MGVVFELVGVEFELVGVVFEFDELFEFPALPPPAASCPLMAFLGASD